MIKNKIAEQIFIDALPCEIVVTDKSGKIIKANRDYCKAKNFPPEKIFFKGQRTRDKGKGFSIPRGCW